MNILALDLSGLTVSIREYHLTNGDIRTWCVFRTLELGNGRLCPRNNAVLTRAAFDSLKGDVGKQCASLAIPLFARKWAVCLRTSVSALQSSTTAMVEKSHSDRAAAVANRLRGTPYPCNGYHAQYLLN